jgi:G3E family GTPase
MHDALLAENTREHAEEEIIEMMNGCICCTVRQDLVAVLKKLAARVASGTLHLDGIVIETTGLADPAPVAQTFFVDSSVRAFCVLDGIITLVDAKHIEQHLDEQKPEGVENEAEEQLAFADRVLLNKTDLVSEADLERVEGRIRAINRFAPIQRCQQSAVSVDSVLGIQGFDLQRTLEMDPGFLNTDEEHSHTHDSTVTSLSIVLPGELDLDEVQKWVSRTLREKGASIFRMKGVLSIAHSEEKFVYQAVHMIFNGHWTDDPRAEGQERVSKLVLIGKNLDHDELRQGFAACIYSAERAEQKLQSLRFAAGDIVECRFSGGWRKGRIEAVMFRAKMPGSLGKVAPYCVRVLDGPRMLVPADNDDCIRQIPS